MKEIEYIEEEIKKTENEYKEWQDSLKDITWDELDGLEIEEITFARCFYENNLITLKNILNKLKAFNIIANKLVNIRMLMHSKNAKDYNLRKFFENELLTKDEFELIRETTKELKLC